MTLASITNSALVFAKNLLHSGKNPSFSSWDNNKTFHLNLLLLVSTISCVVFVLANLSSNNSALVYGGLSIIVFNVILFSLQAAQHQYIARMLTCFGYPAIFVLLIVLGQGDLKGEYAFFLMILLCVLFFRTMWLQIAMIGLVYSFFFTSQLILLYQFQTIDSWSTIFNNSIIFLGISFGLVIVTNSFIRQIISANKEKSRLLAELAYSNEELKRLNYMVSHDLRTPLRQIVSFSKLAQISNQQGELSSSFEYMELVESSAKELYQMTENLLALAHLDHNQLKTEQVDLEGIFEKMQRQFTKIEGEHPIRIHKNAQQLQLQASPILLQMLLQNLVENGIKYNESPEKEIWLEAEEAEQETRVYVRDNGIGIADTDRDKIFGVFHRLNHNKYQGTGLGLAIAKKIMDIHSGSIEVTTGKLGTDFLLLFPKVVKKSLTDNSQQKANIPIKAIYQLSKQGRAIF